MPAIINIKVFWDVTQCSLVDGYLSATQDAIISKITTIKAKICSFYNLFLVEGYNYKLITDLTSAWLHVSAARAAIFRPAINEKRT